MGLNDYLKNELDLMNLNSIYFDCRRSREMIMNKKGSDHLFSYTLIRLLYVICLELVKTVIRTPLSSCFTNSFKKLNNKIVFYLPTNNNKAALQLVVNEVCEKRKDVIVLDKKSEYKYFPFFQILLVSVIYIPQLLSQIRKLSKRDRSLVNCYIRDFFMTPGVVWFYHKMLNTISPNSFILANDHSYETKSLILICEKYKVKTIYIQHASVSIGFPELHFTYSFLDGRDALDVYMYNGKKINGDVLVLGASRYDDLSIYRKKRKFRDNNGCVGIAINEFDDNKRTDELCNSILDMNPSLKIKIRSHPALKRKPFVLSNKKRIIYTCATDESIIDYFDSIDILISGSSGIHLDALLSGVKTYYYNLTCYPFFDNYGYVKNGLLKKLDRLEDVNNTVLDYYDKKNNFTINKEYLLLYDASYGKEYSGNCHLIIADFIINNCNIAYLVSKYKMEIKNENKISYYFIPI